MSVYSIDSDIKYSKVEDSSSNAFEETSIQKRLFRKFKFSPLRFLGGALLGLSCGLPLLTLGPCIISWISAFYSEFRKVNMPQKNTVIKFIVVLGLSWVPVFLNASTIYLLYKYYWSLDYTIIYVSLVIPYLMIVCDNAAEFASNRKISLIDLLAVFCVKNAYMHFCYRIGFPTSVYFNKIWNYFMDSLTFKFKSAQEKKHYMIMSGAVYICLISSFGFSLPRFLSGPDNYYFSSLCIGFTVATLFSPFIQTASFEQRKYIEFESLYNFLLRRVWQPQAYVELYDRLTLLVKQIMINNLRQTPYVYGNTALIGVFLVFSGSFFMDKDGETLKRFGSERKEFGRLCLILLAYFAIPPLTKIYYGFLINFIGSEILFITGLVHSISKLLTNRVGMIDLSQDHNILENLTDDGKLLKRLRENDIQDNYLREEIQKRCFQG